MEARQYGKDVIALKELVKELYPDPSTQPKVLGPAGFYDEKWFNEFLQATGPGVVDGLTHHIYNLGAGTYYKAVQIRAKFTQTLDLDNVPSFRIDSVYLLFFGFRSESPFCFGNQLKVCKLTSYGHVCRC